MTIERDFLTLVENARHGESPLVDITFVTRQAAAGMRTGKRISGLTPVETNIVEVEYIDDARQILDTYPHVVLFTGTMTLTASFPIKDVVSVVYRRRASSPTAAPQRPAAV